MSDKTEREDGGLPGSNWALAMSIQNARRARLKISGNSLFADGGPGGGDGDGGGGTGGGDDSDGDSDGDSGGDSGGDGGGGGDGGSDGGGSDN
ncbi:hypothetical protein [Uliginosibacterium sediminicola]|uniref:Uncharacterized protein n=1 Tax=Uliginosibacterium sediminicola TaxID=2024550 RepID=A0ABU9YTW9_9RHOO